MARLILALAPLTLLLIGGAAWVVSLLTLGGFVSQSTLGLYVVALVCAALWSFISLRRPR